MAIRSAIETNGNSNGALNDSLLATGADKRFLYSHPIIRAILQSQGRQILQNAGHSQAAIEYMTPILGYLSSAPRSENNGRSWAFREMGDNIGSRRFAEYQSPQTRLVMVDLNRASDGYINAGKHVEEGSFADLKAMTDNIGQRTLARFLLLATDLYRDDKALAEAMAATEFPSSQVVNRLKPLSGILEKLHIPPPISLKREGDTNGNDVIVRVGYSHKPESTQRWIEAAQDAYTVLLAKVRPPTS